MNYRHAFHAGSFADVVKHAALAVLIEHLKGKETAFRVIDTHAGPGLYELRGGPAEKTGEWRNGIGRLWGATLPDGLGEVLAPYLGAVAAAQTSHAAGVHLAGAAAATGGAPPSFVAPVKAGAQQPPAPARPELDPGFRRDDDGERGEEGDRPGAGGTRYPFTLPSLESSLLRYPGSPWLVRHLLRRQDRLTAVELHPEDAAALAALFAGDRQVRTVALDGWLALGSFVPPKERRGLVLVDPPYEAKDEFERLLDGFVRAHRRWPNGIYVIWYPVKAGPAADAFRTALAASGIPRLLAAELTVRRRDAARLLNGSGLVIANPPWRFGEKLEALLSGLAPLLRQEDGAEWVLHTISGESSGATGAP